MSTKSNTNAAAAATLTESELFQRFLDAPLRSDVRSELITAPLSKASTEQHFLDDYYAGCESVGIYYDFPERILDFLRDHPTPSYELDAAIADLKAIVNGLRMLRREFGYVTETTRVEPPEDTGDDEADNEAFRDWENNPRFVLQPVRQRVSTAADLDMKALAAASLATLKGYQA